jgi:ABC-type nitrate/sulfonate/bicarbonate transport system permease component
MARVDKKSLLSPTWKRRLLRSSSVVLLAVAWEWGARMHFVSDFLLPSLSSVLERLWEDVISGDIPIALGLTMARTFAGFAMAAIAGVIVGVTIARLPAVRWFFDPIVSVGNPLPKIAFLPIFIRDGRFLLGLSGRGRDLGRDRECR